MMVMLSPGHTGEGGACVNVKPTLLIATFNYNRIIAYQVHIGVLSLVPLPELVEASLCHHRIGLGLSLLGTRLGAEWAASFPVRKLLKL